MISIPVGYNQLAFLHSLSLIREITFARMLLDFKQTYPLLVTNYFHTGRPTRHLGRLPPIFTYITIFELPI